MQSVDDWRVNLRFRTHKKARGGDISLNWYKCK